MSADSLPPRPPISLSLVARPGITIRVLDGALAEIGRGTERFEKELAQGLYLVEWSSAGQQAQTIVRLDGSQDKVEVQFDPSDLKSPGAFDSKSSDRIALVDAVNGAVKPSERSYESSIVLVVTGETDVLAAAGGLDLRLYDREEVAMRANPNDAPSLELGRGEHAYCYDVRPGRYHIGFRSILGQRLGQSVPALAGRQTLVFLTVSRTNLIVADGDEFHKEDSVGIDPARTTIVTVRGDENDYRVRERVRLAGLMLFDLANGTNSLSTDVVDVLDDPMTDPLLKLYGAFGALSALERHGSFAASEPSQGSRPPTYDQSWIERLAGWIGDPSQRGLPTDATAACWELHRLNPHIFGTEKWARLPSRIETPPMLECAWRWAIEESIQRPGAVRGAAIVATARSSGGSQPWLCWQLAAATAKFKPVGPAVDDLPSLLTQVAQKVASLVQVEPNGVRRTLSKQLDALGPEVQATALRAMQLALPTATKVSAGIITDLAVALGLPSQQLRKRLANTKAALDDATPSAQSWSSGATATDARSPSGKQAPGLSRRIRYKNDLQKGRFGGNASRGGFTASAEFEKTRSKNWVKIVLRVEGPGRDGEEAQFHLHDSFMPPLRSRKFKAGVARLAVTVWGGFTLGVWIPAHDVELELDLTELDDAPRIVRER